MLLWRKGFDILLTECCDERDLIFYEQNVVVVKGLWYSTNRMLWRKGFDILLTKCCCGERVLIFY